VRPRLDDATVVQDDDPVRADVEIPVAIEVRDDQ
jgi:hypothetical protein